LVARTSNLHATTVITLYDYCHPWFCSSYVPINDLDALTKQLKRESIKNYSILHQTNKIKLLAKRKKKVPKKSKDPIDTQPSFSLEYHIFVLELYKSTFSSSFLL